MVAQQVHQSVCACPITVAHRRPLPTGIIVFGHRLQAAVPLEVFPHVGGAGGAPHFDLRPVVAGVDRRAVQVVPYIAHVLLGEGVRLARQRLGVLALGGAVEHGYPGTAIGAHLGLGVVVGAPVAVVVPHHHLVHRVSRSQVDLHVLQSGDAAVAKLPVDPAAAIGLCVAVGGGLGNLTARCPEVCQNMPVDPPG